MNPLTRILPAARQRIQHLSRRDVVIMGASAIAMKVADVALDKLVVDPLLDRKMVETYRATPLSMARLATHGGPIQHAALDAWKLRTPLPWFARTRSTMTYRGPDGGQWIDWQGEEASLLLWGREHPRWMPMRQQPDPAFGAWAAKRLEAFRGAEEPAFYRVAGKVERADGQQVEQSYSVLMLPFADGRVQTTSVRWPSAPEASVPRSPTSYIPGSAARGLRRSAST